MSDTPHFFVDEDGYGEPCIWHGLGPDDQDCKLTARKHALDRESTLLWPLVVAALTAAPSEQTYEWGWEHPSSGEITNHGGDDDGRGFGEDSARLMLANCPRGKLKRRPVGPWVSVGEAKTDG